MLPINRKTLLIKYGNIKNEVRGTLGAFGVELSGRAENTSDVLKIVEAHRP